VFAVVVWPAGRLGQMIGSVFRGWGAESELPADPRIQEHLARHRAAEAKAWWRDMTGLVTETDLQLVVIKPRSDATAEELRHLGQALARWQIEFPQARHIWGLTDLLEGRGPRTPPIHVAVPFPSEKYEDAFEPVALVYVARGTDLEAAARDLSDRLSEVLDRLVWFGDSEEYSSYQR
jgi:hypothetical protein